MAHVQVITGPERRRPWSDAQKRAIVAAAFAPEAVESEVARQAEFHSSLIYRGRQEFRASSPGFAELIVPPGRPDTPEPPTDVDSRARARLPIPASAPAELVAAVIPPLRRR